jgi:two-component system OmpR family sensor kinase
MRMPLKARLTLLYVTLFTVIVAAWSVFVVAVVRTDLYAGIDRGLDSRASQIALGLQGSGEGEFQDITDSTLVGLTPTEATAQLLSASGTVLESSGDTMSLEPIVSADVVSRVGQTRAAQTLMVTAPDGESFRVLIVGMTGSDRLIFVGASTENADASVARLAAVMLLTGPLALLAAGIGGWLLARRALRPVARMTSTAAGIRIDALEERVPVPPGGDELAALAVTLNNMLSRLEAGVRDKRRLIADASHELQTPLAVIRTELDVSLASGALQPAAIEVLESAREEVDRMARIVRNLLTLAHFDEGTLRLLPASVDLHELASETVASLGTLARERSVTVRLEGEAIEVVADAEYLRVVVTNLLENAIKYSGPGTAATVSTWAENAEALLTVTDTGPGIPQDALPHVFDRFYRADSARAHENDGSGLGLAIAHEIVQAHGGRLTAESGPGAGSRFMVRLPARPPDRVR